MPANVRIAVVEPFTRWMETRFPFRYGIASMTRVPHLFLRVTLEVDGAPTAGICSEGLPPKWFTKDPETTFEDDLPDLVGVVQNAAKIATNLPPAESIFQLWQALHREQEAWAENRGLPPLLANLGVSMVERGAIDAFCRATGVPFAAALRENRFAVDLGEIHPALNGCEPADLLPNTPLNTIQVRHTVGLGDPLTAEEIPDEDRADDGLPQALADCIQAYGLRYFKVKLSGDLATDRARLLSLAELLTTRVAGFRFTLDGNEQFAEIGQFRQVWTELAAEPALTRFLSPDHLLFVEQPLHRNTALQPEVAEALQNWPDAPPIIIDESDAELSSLPTALNLGYAGTSHKSCKGVIKGIANACLLEHLRRENPGKSSILSGEDLATVGPVTLLQDLAVMAALGISHVERNGHHYFRGLAAFPSELQQIVATQAHPGLYHLQGQGNIAALAINAGNLDLPTLNAAPFGTNLEPSEANFALLGAPGWP